MTPATHYSMAPQRASTRVSIAWSGQPPDEDTDTLVLTLDGISLDLRVFISGPDKGKIDWASVGMVRKVESKDGVHLAWDQVIDSRGPRPEDASSFTTLPNGDVVEAGTMYNPKTDRSEAFEEVWHRHSRQKGWLYVVLERVDGQWGQSEGDQAFLACLGPRHLGLAQHGNVFRAYRDEDGNSLYEFNVDDKVIPRFEVDPEWKKGETVCIGQDADWVVRTIGTLE